mgnify:FL=1
MAIQKTEDSIYINTITSMLVVTITYTILNSAGWIATTVNYMWPLSFGIMGLYPLRKFLEHEKINGFEMNFLQCLSADRSKRRTDVSRYIDGICDI